MEVDLQAKYYRAIKDSFLWKEGAILIHDPEQGNRGVGGYAAISDVWDANEALGDEYISGDIIEGMPDWFERVYPIKQGEKISFTNAESAKKAYSEGFEPIKIK